MITLYSANHELHAPEFEIFRGQLVTCFESPVRADIVLQELQARGYDIREPVHECSELLTQVHAERYIAFLKSAWDQWCAADSDNAALQPFPSVWPVRSLRSDVEPVNFIARLGLYSMDNGTPLTAGAWSAAKAGGDAAASAAALLGSGVSSVFCATRPPGHHAGPDFMGGYCFLNNAAIAAQSLKPHGFGRVAVLDVDYHHGNGTQSIFYARNDVLVVNIHGDPGTEYPFFLGYQDETGIDQGEGFNLNLPLPPGTEAQTWFTALEVACKRVAEFRADAIVVSLGLDTFENDPISEFRLKTEDFSDLGRRLAMLKLPSIFILEGGYATRELGQNTANVLDAFEQG